MQRAQREPLNCLAPCSVIGQLRMLLWEDLSNYERADAARNKQDARLRGSLRPRARRPGDYTGWFCGIVQFSPSL
jgi:hypothetical protein